MQLGQAVLSPVSELVGCYNDAIVAMLALYDSAAVQLCRKLELQCFWVFASFAIPHHVRGDSCGAEWIER